ncbi:hypothetical protein ACHWQZ_G001444 [Mnemiopsis leidyi]
MDIVLPPKLMKTEIKEENGTLVGTEGKFNDNITLDTDEKDGTATSYHHPPSFVRDKLRETIEVSENKINSSGKFPQVAAHLEVNNFAALKPIIVMDRQTKNLEFSVSKDRSFLCPFCPYAAVKRSSLIKHQRKHSGEKPYPCSECPYKASQKSNLVVHQRIHSGEKPYKCPECPYRAVHMSSFVYHRRKHNQEKPFKCSECSYSAIHKSSLINHRRTHTGEKPYKCPECPYSTNQKSNLNVHRRTHSGEKPYKCTECSYTAHHKSSLTNHQRTHTGERPYQCGFCSYSARQKSNLVVHMRTHSGEKPYQCSMCSYTARQKSCLINHERIHTGEKPFKCEQCTYRARKKSALIYHMRTHNVRRENEVAMNSSISEDTAQRKEVSLLTKDQRLDSDDVQIISVKSLASKPEEDMEPSTVRPLLFVKPSLTLVKPPTLITPFLPKPSLLPGISQPTMCYEKPPTAFAPFRNTFGTSFAGLLPSYTESTIQQLSRIFLQQAFEQKF